MKNDKYRKARGGRAFMVDVCCMKCGAAVLLYQKDGDGPLKRCYLNRITAPPELERLQHDPAMTDPRLVPPISCPRCSIVLGAAIRHHDGRIAFRLRPGFFFKKRKMKSVSQ